MDMPGLQTPPPSGAVAFSEGGQQPPAPPAPPVLPENPVIQKPTNPSVKQFKKIAPKFAVGTLVIALLVGGLVLGKNLLPQKTSVEKKAADCVACSADQSDCRKRSGSNLCDEYLCNCSNPSCCFWYKSGENCDCGISQPSPSGGCPDGWDDCGTQCCNHDTKCCTTTGCKDSQSPECESSPNPSNPPRSPSPSGSPSPSPSPSPSTSPSPLPFSCVDLTASPAPALNKAVTFTCEASFSSGTPVAFFRYSKDNGTTYGGALPKGGAALDPTMKKASYKMTIDAAGDWKVQCQVCTDGTRAN